MNYFPELQYRFPIVTPAGTATIDFPETQWDVAVQAAIIGPGAATVKDYLSVHGIGFYGHLFTLDAVSPMDLHHALLMNSTTHKNPAIFRFDVIGYVPEENPPENDPERWGDEEEDDEEETNGMVMEAEEEMILESSIAANLDAFIHILKQHIAAGKSTNRDDIYAIYNNIPKVVGHVPVEISKALRLADPFVYCGLAHFIDHHFNNHPSTPIQKYKTIDDVLATPEEVRRDDRGGKINTFAFIKYYDNFHCVVIDASLEKSKLVLHKTFFEQTKKPYKNLPLVWSIAELSVSEGLGSVPIGPDAISSNPAGNRISSRSETPHIQNIPPSSSEVKKEDVVTESATFDYRAAIQQATSFDDIKAAFQKAFPIIIPANLPAKASGINFLDTGKGKPNTVYRDIYDLYTYEHLGLISEPYDGTLESLMAAWEKVQQRLNDYHNASNSNSPIAATDASGRAKYYVSPNGRIIRDLQTGEEINTDAYRERDVKKELQDQGFIVDTNIDGGIISLRLNGNIALRDRYGRWKLYEGEQNEKNLIGDDFTQSEVVKEMKGMILESADREAIASGRFFTEGELRAMARRLKERDRTKADNFHKRLKAKLGQADVSTADLESSESTLEPWQIKKAEFIALQNNLLPDWEPGIGFYGGYEFVMPDKSTRSYKGPVYTKEGAIEVFHRESVSMAMQMGLPIPPVVLEDYPELVENILESALTAEEIHDIAHQAATSHKNDLPEPTEAQAKAGNYKHGHLKLYGLDITIENPAGSKRSGIDPDGKPWECIIPAHYGFFKRTMGSDGDHVDCYIGESPESERVFIVDQMDLMTGCFDEHKTVLATLNEEEARNIYIAGFSDGKGPDRIGAITEMDMEEFKVWLAEGETTQPVGRITIPQI